MTSNTDNSEVLDIVRGGSRPGTGALHPEAAATSSFDLLKRGVYS